MEHVIGASLLRKPAAWEGDPSVGLDGGRWLLRPDPQILFLNGTLRAVLEEQKSRKKKRPTAAGPEGAPREKASSYALGSRRKGTDGQMWEVCSDP